MAIDDRFSAYAGRVSARAASNKASGTSGFTGGGGSNENKGTGQGSVQEVPSTGHDLLDQYNKLKAEGKGDTSQAQELARYLGKVEQKYQSEGRSLYPEQYQQEQYEMAAGVGEFGGKPLTEWEKIQKLASMEAADPKYAKSFEGTQFMDQMRSKDKSGKPIYDQFTGMSDKELQATDSWRDRFGLGHIVATSWESGQPIGPKYDNKGNIIPEEEKYLYTGLGRSMMDQLEGATSQTSFDEAAYGTGKETYWTDRTAQEERTRSLDQGQRQVGGGGGGGSGGGGGYYGDPRTGNPIDRYGNFYTPQANLQQAMVNVHGTPTGFRGPGQSGFQMKRGGIVSLLELRS